MGATSGSRDALNQSDTVEITGKIMVVAIIFLFIVVTFVLLLHLYAKWFWWRIETTNPQPRRSRRRQRRFVFAPGQDPVVIGTHQIGLDPSVLKSLPVMIFQTEDFKDGLECAVCLSEIVQGEKARLLPKCNHGFHLDCIDMWFHSHSTCPLCRNPVSLNLEENILQENVSLEAEDENSASKFPTNVLVWGNQTQVSTTTFEEGTSQQPSSSSSSSTSNSDGINGRCNGILVIDIPCEFNSSSSSSSFSPSGNRCVEDEVKSPMATKLRSFKRLLSWDKKLSPSSMDLEQVHG